MTALAASPESDVPTVSPLQDPRDPMVRIERLGAITEVLNDDDGVVVAALVADGVPMIAFATDPRRQGGAMGTKGCEALYEAYELAVERAWPVVGIWHSGGARLTEGVDSLHGVGRVFAAMTLASGKIPQLSLVLGPAAGGAAYGPALTDVVIMGPEGRIFVTGPDVVRSVTGEDVDMARLGGPEPHGRSSGLASVVAATDEEAYAATRRIAALLTAELPRVPVFDRPLEGFLPERTARAYDVKPLINAILDEAPTELHGRWAPNLVTALGTLGGQTVGVLANNPLRLGGCLDAAAGDKAARFVRMCDAFGIPLLVIVDVPGYLPGTGQEWNGVVRRGAKLLHAFAAASVPRITLVTRKAYGGAYIAMNSRALGATHVLAWPKAQVDVMGAVAAVRILHRRQIAAVPDEEKPMLEARLAEEHVKVSGGLERAIEGGMVDEIIQPDATRTRLAALLAEHPSDRGTHGNIPPLMGLLDGKRLLITGVLTEASIAFTVAKLAQEQGAELVLTGFGRGLGITERIAKRLPEKAPVIELDVTNDDHLALLPERLGPYVDGLDGVLHAIAFAPAGAIGGNFMTATWEDVSTAVHVSTFSLAALARAVLPILTPGSGIVGLDFDATVAWPAYDWMGVAKAGLESTARYLAREVGPQQIRVNLVAAGPLRTIAAKAIEGFENFEQVWGERAPLGWDNRDTGPAARACVALLSDWFPATTGEIVHVDGGMHAVGA